MGRSRDSRRARGPRRPMLPGVEPLDGRVLLSGATAAVGKLGPFIEPGAIRPRIQQAPTVVNASPVLNQYLIALLGPEEMEQVRAQAAARGVGFRPSLYQRVLSQPPVGGILGSLDTYTLLNAPATQALVGFNTVAPDAEATVRYTVPRENIIGIETGATTVQIPPEGNQAGFIATVPNQGVRELPDGLFVVDVPIDQVPADAPAPPPDTVGTGALSPIYRSTGPLLTQALLTGLHQRGPNAPVVVRGLRTSRLLGDPRVVPHGLQANYLRLMRVAVERDAFDPTPAQSQQISDGIQQFFTEVADLDAAGAFNPPVPLPTPPTPLAGARLGGTLQVTNGAVRDLINVAPGQSGLQFSGLNFPGRIDSGFVIAANGDYGLVLKARGPLQAAPAGFDTDVVGGDVRVELSNALRLADLDGLRVEEGTYVGSVVSGEVTTSRAGNLATLGASAGFGTGLAFGTGVSYTRVIPLGNLNALIPQFPPS